MHGGITWDFDSRRVSRPGASNLQLITRHVEPISKISAQLFALIAHALCATNATCHVEGDDFCSQKVLAGGNSSRDGERVMATVVLQMFLSDTMRKAS